MSAIKKTMICASAFELLITATLGFGTPLPQSAACSVFTGSNQCHVGGMQGRNPVCICNPGAAGDISNRFAVQSNEASPEGGVLRIINFDRTTASLLLCPGSSWGKWNNNLAWTCLTAAQKQQVQENEAAMHASSLTGIAATTRCQADWNNLKQVPGTNLICGGLPAQVVQSLQAMPGAKLEALSDTRCIVGTPSTYLKWKGGNMLNSCIASTWLKRTGLTKTCQNDITWNVKNGCKACGGFSNDMGFASCKLSRFHHASVNSQGQCVSFAETGGELGYSIYTWTPGNMSASCSATHPAYRVKALVALCQSDVASNVNSGCNACGGVSNNLVACKLSSFHTTVNSQGWCVSKFSKKILNQTITYSYSWFPREMNTLCKS